MNAPGIVQSSLEGEEVATRVSLGGEDELFVTPTRTLIYRAEGLLSDESVEEFPHDATRLTLSEGRRKARISLEYALDDGRNFAVPASKASDALHPVLEGVLSSNGILDEDEEVVETFRFSELTLVVTSERLVKHIGEAVWDEDYEEFHYEDVTRLDFEEGSHSTQIVLRVDGRPQRIKAPRDRANEVTEHLKRSLFAYHDVSSVSELNALLGDDEEAEASVDPAEAFGEGVAPLGTSFDEDEVEADSPETEADDDTAAAEPDSTDADTDDADDADAVEEPSTTEEESTDEFSDSGFEPADTSAVDSEVVAELRDLRAVVDRQTQLLQAQQQTIDTLIEELRRGR